MTEKLHELFLRLRALSVLRELRHDPVIEHLTNFLYTVQSHQIPAFNNIPTFIDGSVDAYTDFVFSLYETGSVNLSRYIQNIVNNNENIYIKLVGQGIKPSTVLEKSLAEDLVTMQTVASLTPNDLKSEFPADTYLPEWETEDIDITGGYRERIASIGKYGYGIYAAFRMFYINQDKQIVPVQNPDRTRLCDLIDYEREKKIIIDNTKALLDGKPAANILLTGDAGTGKSSTVKAVVNELYNEGLRILEVRKEQLHEMPAILDELTTNPLKFIIFIDDLSFSSDDDNFSALKAVLEGSVSAKSQNVVIYATSNRRHLVKERFSDREGDEIHLNDSIQEIVSLSERFGIQITFNRPDKNTYLDIVHHLADAHGIKYIVEKLDMEAEKFALRRSSRSARAAKQFVDGLLAGSTADII